MKWPAKINNWLNIHPLVFVGLLLVYILFDHAPDFIAAFSKNRKQIVQEVNVSQTSGNTKGAGDLGTGDVFCRTESIQTNRNLWDTNFFREKKDGYFCPKEGWTDPVIWYTTGIKSGFKSLEVQYIVKQGTTTNPPSLILAFGDVKPIFKLWIPEGETLQLFRFSWNQDLDSNELTPDLAETLPDPVKVGRPDTVKIEQGTVSGNEVTLNITYSYTSNLSVSGTKGIFSKKVKMLDSNIQTSTLKYPFGVGTYLGNCIKPISYTICE